MAFIVRKQCNIFFNSLQLKQSIKDHCAAVWGGETGIYHWWPPFTWIFLLVTFLLGCPPLPCSPGDHRQKAWKVQKMLALQASGMVFGGLGVGSGEEADTRGCGTAWTAEQGCWPLPRSQEAPESLCYVCTGLPMGLAPAFPHCITQYRMSRPWSSQPNRA